MKIALCGNPNVGKTTLFNRITRSDAPVGNWHGVTVDVRSKRIGNDVMLSDLPGAYSLTPRTPEERITRDAVLYGGYDAIVYVAEVNNLRRNLYMFLQLIEAGKRVALVVNMMDEAKGKVDLALLERRLGVPVIGTSIKTKNPKSAILDAVNRAVVTSPRHINAAATPIIKDLTVKLGGAACAAGVTPLFAAVKTLERDADIMSALGASEIGSAGKCGNCAECADMPARLRYEYLDSILVGVIEKRRADERTRRLDKVILGKLALPIFLCVMAAVFFITFEAGRPLSDWLIALVNKLDAPIERLNAPDWVKSLLYDGIVSGVGGVLAFLPQVVILYLLTALLQDSGYMSRVAFVTDGFFKKFGLSGRAAFSVVLGLGCSASAVLTTRGISGEAARRRAALVTPFCPCSARLAVFAALSGYFGFSGIAVAAMYVIGFAVALIVLKVLCLFQNRDGVDSELIMEMPPYRLPGIRRVASVVWRNTIAFIARVGTTVLAVGIIMWVLCNFSVACGFNGGGESSIMNTVAELVAPIFVPLGFGTWKAVAALLSGVAAKESVVSVISALGGMGEVFTSPQAAMSFMIFTCLYVPCVATLAAIAKECGFKYAVLSVLIHSVAAYFASLVYFQAATLYAENARLFAVIMGCVCAAAIMAIIIASTARRISFRRKTRICNGKKA